MNNHPSIGEGRIFDIPRFLFAEPNELYEPYELYEPHEPHEPYELSS